MKTLIEVGSFDGKDSLKFHKKRYRVFTFEPKKDLFESLKQKTKHLRNYTVINKAVCSTNGTMMFNICKQGGASSLLEFKPDAELESHWGKHRQDIHYANLSYEVQTTRLDTFIEENSLQDTTIDYIHIDAQGVDLECLMSLGKYISNVKEGVLETVIDPIKSIYVNQNQNTLENIKKFLEDNSFMIKNVIPNDNTGCEYNVYFVKKN